MKGIIFRTYCYGGGYEYYILTSQDLKLLGLKASLCVNSECVCVHPGRLQFRVTIFGSCYFLTVLEVYSSPNSLSVGVLAVLVKGP